MAKREEEERISQDIGARSAASAGRNTYDDRYMSEKDYAKISKYGDDYNAAKEAGDEEGMALAHAAAEGLRAKYSYSGGADGSQYLPNGQGGSFSYDSAPSYTSRYQKQIDELSRAILGREAFSYDYQQDPTYQQYADSYTRNGQRAMEDTLGQVSTRTGGLASSYATTASQQTYDGYMAALADKIPELRQLAYEMYRDEGADQRTNLSMLQALEQGDYGKYQDLLGQYNTDRSFNYGVYGDDRAYGYQAGRDRIEDQRYGDETAWNRDAYRSETQYDQALRKAETLAAAGDFSGYRALGYSDQEIQAMGDAYTRDQAAARLGGGRSGGDESGGGEDLYQTLYDAGATDYGTAYAKLISQGYSSSEAKEMATYFAETWYADKQEGRGKENLGTGARNLRSQLDVIPGLTQDNKVAMVEDALNHGKITEQEADWLLDYLGY